MNPGSMTDDDVALIRLIVTTAILHGSMSVVATLPGDQQQHAIDKLLQLSDTLVARAGIKATTP